MYLKTSVSSQSITDTPTAANFCVFAWVYVNSWDTTALKNIFVLSNGSSPILTLDLDKTKPTLSTTIYGLSTDPAIGATSNPIIITNNFPIQRWVFVIVSVSSSIVDCYLDGRLVSSYQLPSNLNTNVSNAKTLTMDYAKPTSSNGAIGSYTPIDVFLYSVQRYSYAMDPTTAQNLYYYSSPPASSSINYNVVVELEKNGQVSNSFKLI